MSSNNCGVIKEDHLVAVIEPKVLIKSTDQSFQIFSLMAAELADDQFGIWNTQTLKKFFFSNIQIGKCQEREHFKKFFSQIKQLKVSISEVIDHQKLKKKCH